MSLDATFEGAVAPALKTESIEWKDHFNRGLNAVFGIGTKVAGIATAAAIVPAIAAGVPGAMIALPLVWGTTHAIGSVTQAVYETEAREDAREANPSLPRPDFLNIVGHHLASPF